MPSLGTNLSSPLSAICLLSWQVAIGHLWFNPELELIIWKFRKTFRIRGLPTAEAHSPYTRWAREHPSLPKYPRPHGHTGTGLRSIQHKRSFALSPMIKAVRGRTLPPTRRSALWSRGTFILLRLKIRVQRHCVPPLYCRCLKQETGDTTAKLALQILDSLDSLLATAQCPVPFLLPTLRVTFVVPGGIAIVTLPFPVLLKRFPCLKSFMGKTLWQNLKGAIGLRNPLKRLPPLWHNLRNCLTVVRRLTITCLFLKEKAVKRKLVMVGNVRGWEGGKGEVKSGFPGVPKRKLFLFPFFGLSRGNDGKFHWAHYTIIVLVYFFPFP